MIWRASLAALLGFIATSVLGEIITKDVIIYGGSPAAITAAIQVARMGKSVAIVFPETTVGGMTVNGLSWTDSKDGKAIGGIAREFYMRVFEYYGNSRVWKFHQTRQDFLAVTPNAQPGPSIDFSEEEQWVFEPRVAQKIFDAMLVEAQVNVYNKEYLDRENGVHKDGAKIISICMLSGNCYRAKQFIDAGYEGDFMAAVGIPFSTGRDAKTGPNGTDEGLAGMFLVRQDDSLRNYDGVDPYRVKGDPYSGLLHGIEGEVSDPAPEGWSGRHDPLRIQSYTFRPTLTSYPRNRVRISKPEGYDVSKYELMLRLYEAYKPVGFTTHTRLPNRKIDANSQGQMSLDFIGGNVMLAQNVSWATASYDQRRNMSEAHRKYQLGLLYTLQHSPRISFIDRQRFQQWGLAKDEFVDNNNWPRMLYVREARRMSGAYALHQHAISSGTDGYIATCGILGVPAGMGSYSIDSHNVRRLVQAGRIYDEGMFYVKNPHPFPIPYAALLPRAEHAVNFVNPVTLSMSHVALGSVRMEPTYMILGQSAGIVAVRAIEEGRDVQKVKMKGVMKELKKWGQVVS